LQSLQQRAELGDVVNVIMVDTTRMERVRAEIREIEPFAVHDTSDLIKQAEEANATGVVIRWIMIGLTLIIAGLFVSNMLARSVSERRLEFATLRAIGISSRLILLTIAAQATLISIAAWFVGLLISASFGGMINATVAPQYGIESLYAADARLFLLVFAMSATLGLVSGLVPARQATRIDPVLVLREA
jgi:putative ABC transport system permease protein